MEQTPVRIVEKKPSADTLHAELHWTHESPYLNANGDQILRRMAAAVYITYNTYEDLYNSLQGRQFVLQLEDQKKVTVYGRVSSAETGTLLPAWVKLETNDPLKEDAPEPPFGREFWLRNFTVSSTEIQEHSKPVNPVRYTKLWQDISD